jgi:hypothetical protein
MNTQQLSSKNEIFDFEFQAHGNPVVSLEFL